MENLFVGIGNKVEIMEKQGSEKTDVMETKTDITEILATQKIPMPYARRVPDSDSDDSDDDEHANYIDESGLYRDMRGHIHRVKNYIPAVPAPGEQELEDEIDANTAVDWNGYYKNSRGEIDRMIYFHDKKGSPTQLKARMGDFRALITSLTNGTRRPKHSIFVRRLFVKEIEEVMEKILDTKSDWFDRGTFEQIEFTTDVVSLQIIGNYFFNQSHYANRGVTLKFYYKRIAKLCLEACELKGNAFETFLNELEEI